MQKYSVLVYSWEPLRQAASDLDLQNGDLVVVKEDSYNEIGIIESFESLTSEDKKTTIVRKATKRDIETSEKNKEKRAEILQLSKSEVKRLGLNMKLVDVHVSLDGSNAIVLFTADERIDFRELVKNLSKIFHRSVRLHQVGSRDEARKIGGCGVCGRDLCCLRFQGSLPSISIDMARVQQVAHRGSERISGACGRLMCCLSYEAQQYREMLEGFPEMHSVLTIKEGKGEVIELNALSGDIKLRMADGSIVIVKKDSL
ncbi:MAG TPA: regulatory iron-sulfur-containing complex subunit RicT [Candidatus Moranbacteria bacterium]|jgi:cell fate regulator YaaT (PSP1 superfamily)|nr:regulatory iron-sulfur-containing complex subunit RicT [Candidatus Moranbacteria bacterium]HRY27914.1 regulatory iron-sulfur-containing complex subunit RicT [Candidatus Moranbacteria bacterium]HSA08385.1 regulatory iron-sulfur-containing complex subunit RicT [Candidatus Moranbacteria bacterium]